MKPRSIRLRLAIYCLLLILLGIAALHLPPVRSYALNALKTSLRKGAGIELTAKSLSYNLLTFKAELKEVELHSAAANGEEPFLKADSVRAGVRFFSLLHGEPVVDHAQLDGLQLRINVDSSGESNLPQTQPSRATAGDAKLPGLPFPWIIEDLAAPDASFAYASAVQDVALDLPSWSLTILGNASDRSQSLRFVTNREGKLSLHQRLLPIEKLSLGIGLGPEKLRLEEFSLLLGESRLQGDGTVEDFDHPEIDSSIRASLDIGSILRLLGVDPQASGMLDIDASVSGPASGMVLVSQITSPDLDTKYFDHARLSATIRWEEGSGRIRIGDFRAESTQGVITGEADLALSVEQGLSSASILLDKIELERATRDLLPFGIASRASGSIRAEWNGLDITGAKAGADLRIAAKRKTPSKGTLPVTANLVADITRNRLEVRVKSARTLNIGIRGQLSLISWEQVEGRISTESTQMESLIPSLEAFLGKKPGSLVPTSLEGPLEVHAELGGNLGALKLKGDVRGPDTAVGDLRHVNVQTQFSYSPERIEFLKAEAVWRDQILSAEGRMEFGKKDINLDFRMQVDNGSLKSLAAAAEKNWPVEGRYNLSAIAGGSLEKPVLSAEASIRGLSFYRKEMGTVSLQADLSDNRINLVHLELNQAGDASESGRLAAVGSFYLDTGAYTLQCSGSDLRLDIGEGEIPGIPEMKGVLALNASGAGSMDNPELDADVHFSDLQIREKKVGKLDLKGELDKELAALSIRIPDYGMVAQVDTDPHPPFTSRVEMALDTDISALDIHPLDTETLEGHIKATLVGNGNLAEWEAGKASLRATELNAKLRGLEMEIQEPMELGYDNGRFTDCLIRLVVGSSELSLQGSLPLETATASDSLQLQGRLDLQALAPLFEGNGITTGGILRLDGEVRGSAQHIEPDLHWSLSEGSFEHPLFRHPLQDIDLRMDFSRNILNIRSFSSKMGQASIEASGTLPLNGISVSDNSLGNAAVAARFEADVANLEVGSFSSVPESVTGTVGFHLEGETSDIRDINALKARATFSQFTVQSADYGLYQATPVEFSLADGTVSIDHFLLAAPTTRLLARGSLSLARDGPLDVHVSGALDIGAAALLSKTFRAAGDGKFEFNLGGRWSEPKLSGFFELEGGRLSIPSPPISATDLNVRLLIDPKSLKIERFSGGLNGGELSIEGSTGITSSGLQDTNIRASIEDAYLNYPDGLQTRISGRCTLKSQEEFMVLGGRIQISEGAYRKNLDLVRQLLGQLQSDKGVRFAEEKDPFLSRLRFDLNIETTNGLVIDTNVAELNANADLRLTGDYYRTGLVGRITLEEGGQLRFHERKYLVERGVLSFINETAIEPEPDILATTRVADYDITLKLTGSPDNLQANLSSDPPLSQPDIIALLLTGRRLENLQGSGLNVAREQVESYLSGQMADFLSRNAEDAIGLSLVRIDPSLISPEANPGARLTIGNDITDSLFMIYSMNLVDAGDRILSVEYDITRNFRAEMTRQSDNSYRFDLGQDLRFGGSGESAERVKTEKKKIGAIEFTGDPVFPGKTLSEVFGVKTENRYDFFKIQKGLDRLTTFYLKRNRLEARIRIRRNEKEKTIDLTVLIDAGPEVEMQYRGWNPPGETKNHVLSAWSHGLFDGQRQQNAEKEIRNTLAGKCYLEAKIQTEVQTLASGSKSVLFVIDPSVRFQKIDIDFDGTAGIATSTIEKALQDNDLMKKVYEAPEEISDFLRRYYLQHGYLDARVEDPRYELNPDTATGKIIFPITEGPLFKIHEVQVDGNQALTLSRVREEIPFKTGNVYDPEAFAASLDSLEKLYWSQGFNNVILDYALKRSGNEPGTMDILLTIAENSRQYVEEIVLEGNKETSDEMILSQISLKPGDVLDYRETNKSRSQLYDTRAYTFVDIQAYPFSGPQLPTESNRRPVQLKITVKEVSPFRFTYSGFYDTERGGGGIADFSNRNSLGSARLIGTRVRFDADVQEIRGYFSQPFLRSVPINTDITGYFRRESVANEEISNIAFSTDRTGISVQQEAKFGDKFILSYGYRFEHKKQQDFTTDPVQVIIQNTAPLTVTLTRDSRNNLLDAWKGSMLSQAFEYAPSYLGSDLRYYKYLGQYFYYLPLSAPAKIPWAGETRSRLVFATGIRAGFAGGLDGQDLLASDKFFAGGGTTLRGFDQNTVGPLGLEGNPTGGNAIFLVNGELRFPIFSIFDGVGFLDLGNVYPKAGDFDPTDVRAASGFGLRMRTPYFLLRADYGKKLDRKPGESSGGFFFSIGQAF